MDQNLPLPLAKGRQVTLESIMKGVSEVARYLHQKSRRTRKKKGKPKNIRRTEDFYKNKKLYYLISLLSFADRTIFHGESFPFLISIIKQKLLDISTPLMRFIPFKDRCTVIQELQEASNRLLPFWRFSNVLESCTLCACLRVFWPFSFINVSSRTVLAQLY